MLQRVPIYRNQAEHYLRNAQEMLEREDLEKAGEFLWGAMAEAVKAVAAARQRLLRTHRDLRLYARQLARDLDDPSLENAFIRAEHLHSNFYEVFYDREELERETEVISMAVGTLLGLLPARRS